MTKNRRKLFEKKLKGNNIPDKNWITISLTVRTKNIFSNQKESIPTQHDIKNHRTIDRIIAILPKIRISMVNNSFL